MLTVQHQLSHRCSPFIAPVADCPIQSSSLSCSHSASGLSPHFTCISHCLGPLAHMSRAICFSRIGAGFDRRRRQRCATATREFFFLIQVSGWFAVGLHVGAERDSYMLCWTARPWVESYVEMTRWSWIYCFSGVVMESWLREFTRRIWTFSASPETQRARRSRGKWRTRRFRGRGTWRRCGKDQRCELASMGGLGGMRHEDFDTEMSESSCGVRTTCSQFFHAGARDVELHCLLCHFLIPLLVRFVTNFF